jgi:hypothetical protein
VDDDRDQVDDDRDTGSSRRHLVWGAILLLVFVPFALIEGPGAGVLNDLGLTGPGESFTELYFTDHRALPKVVTEGSPLVFDFSVRNREGGAQTYSWQVVVGAELPGSGSADPLVMDQGELRLADDEVGVVHIDRTTSSPAGPAVVAVVLVGRAETIHFLLTFAPAESAAAP